MIPRLTLALDLLAYLVLALLLSGLAGRWLLRLCLRHDPTYLRDIAAGKALDLRRLRFAWQLWAFAVVGAAWLLSGLVR